MNHPKAEAARKAVERMEQERVMVHGIEVKPGQVWEYEPHEGLPSRVANIRGGAILCRDGLDWEPSVFATWHKRLAQPMQPDEAPRWTDAEWAAEQVALSRRQADAARAEARELRAELEALGGQNAAALSRLMAERNEALEELAETRAALGAARAAVPSPGVDPLRPIGADGPWISPRVVAVAEGRDPAQRMRALPVVPATCGLCSHNRHDADAQHMYCGHPGGGRYVENASPPPVCPIRAELAKAGGL